MLLKIVLTFLMSSRVTAAVRRTILPASGAEENVLLKIADGDNIGTMLTADKEPLTARKQWLAGALAVAGRLVIDAGAVRALAECGSLLPVGVVRLEGHFGRGDVVSIVSESGREVGRGLAEYSLAEAASDPLRFDACVAALRRYSLVKVEAARSLTGTVTFSSLTPRDELLP